MSVADGLPKLPFVPLDGEDEGEEYQLWEEDRCLGPDRAKRREKQEERREKAYINHQEEATGPKRKMGSRGGGGDKGRSHSAHKWKPIMLVTIYKMARMGLPEWEIVKALGIARTTLDLWKRAMSEVREVLALAKKENEADTTISSWVYSRLRPELRELWDKISEWEEEPNGVRRIELMLSDHGKKVRQELFLHALCECRFSVSHALGKVNVTKNEFDRWVQEDGEFSKLVTEVEWHKANFYEYHLVNLVQEGNPAATIFANKTINRGRGYATRVEVNVSGTVTHGVIDLVELMPHLSERGREELMSAIRKQEEASLIGDRVIVPPTPTEIISAQIANLPGEKP